MLPSKPPTSVMRAPPRRASVSRYGVISPLPQATSCGRRASSFGSRRSSTGRPSRVELEGEVGRQFPGREHGIALDGLPPLLEGVEALELVARRLEEDAVVAALELRLFLQERDGIRESPRFVLDLAVLAEDPDGQRRQHGEDADDDQDDEDLDQRHAAHGAAR